MSTPLDIPLRTRGRASRPLGFAEVRALDAVDLALLDEEKGSKPPPLKRLGERHHALARCLANAMTDTDAAIACGYSPSRVSILKGDPAFQELMAFYREDTDRVSRTMHESLVGLSHDAIQELHHRLEDDMQSDEKKISVGQLLEMAKTGADRTGHGPQSSSTNLNVNVDLADRLQAARERVASRKVIEHKDVT